MPLAMLFGYQCIEILKTMWLKKFSKGRLSTLPSFLPNVCVTPWLSTTLSPDESSEGAFPPPYKRVKVPQALLPPHPLNCEILANQQQLQCEKA